MIAQVITCDVCGKQKQETNHWFKAFAVLKSRESDAGFHIYPADSPCGHGFVHKDLCGQACAVSALNKWMQEQSR